MANSQAAFESVYEAVLFDELDQILAAIPHQSLAIQWDSAVEFGMIEQTGYWARVMSQWWDGDVWEGVIERAVRQASRVPEPVELGFHLCYGGVAEGHFSEPQDAGNLARFIELVGVHYRDQSPGFICRFPLHVMTRRILCR